MNRTALAALSGAANATGGECPGHSPDDVRGMLAELERRGWKLVRIDPFAKPDWSDASELEGTNEGVWQAHADGLDCGLRPCRQCAGSTNAPAIGGADADPVIHREMRIDDLDERLTRIERYLDARTANSRHSWRNV